LRNSACHEEEVVDPSARGARSTHVRAAAVRWRSSLKCSRCQTENRPGRRFCSQCGAALALACPSCGFANEADEKFCGGCGASLAGAPPPPDSVTTRPIAAVTGSAASRFGSPDVYTPQHLAKKIL